MADQFDRAAEIEQLHRDLALRHRDRGPAILAKGACLCCDAELPAGMRWCDADCRDVWQLQQQRQRRHH